MRNSSRVAVTEASQVGEARRLAARLAGDLGFNEAEAGKVAVVVSEAAGNLARHARDGELLLRVLERNGVMGVEVMALDKGPGMANVAQCLRDGHSTSSGPGIGLGGVSRMASLFDIHSLPGAGTALIAHLWSKPLPRNLEREPLEAGVVCLPKGGEKAWGDGWAIDQAPGRSLVLVADGLGHGPVAAEASMEAIRIFYENRGLGLTALMEAMHGALRSTRGAAVGLAEIDFHHKVVRYAGVGNIAGVILSRERDRNMVSHYGILGHRVRKIQDFTYPWPELALLILHSDGLKSGWSLQGYPGLARKHPGLVAGVLYRDYNRGYDDATVVVVKESFS